MTRACRRRRASRLRTPVLAAVVLVSSLVTACTSSSAPPRTAPTKGMSLAQCWPYGVPSAQVTLKFPGMVFFGSNSIEARAHRVPQEALVAFNKDGTASAILFDGPASDAPDRVQDWMWNANIVESSQWGVDIVAKNAITVSAATATAQATNISHSTFTTRHGSSSATFDYWAFTASGQRYLLSYARTPKVTTPDPATFFATATSCPKST